ncbi:MAG: shikimate kinase [Pirellulales bacterium]
MNIVLIGYRGSGKSTVARELAGRLGWPWLDADHQIEERAGKSIAAIFADEGEQRFRDLESSLLAELVERDKTVLAVGGGAVLRPANRALLRSAGKVVWLQADAATMLARIEADLANAQRRPRLTSAGGEAEVVELLAQRAPLYRECADLAIETQGRSPAEVAGRIIEQLHLSTLSELA